MTYGCSGKSYTNMEYGIVVNTPRLTERLAYWINERESIRVKKEGGLPKPWSDDPVFQTVYFCNVHREDDRVTRWIAENWRQYYPHPNYELAMVMARFINKPSSLLYLGFPEEWDKEEYLQAFQELPSPKWGNAYVITTHGQKMPKDEYVFDALDEMAPLLYNVRWYTLCRHTYEYLKGFDGLGSFLAAQVVADLKNTINHPLHHSPDYVDFVAPGPGSLRGLEWYYGYRIGLRDFDRAIRTAYAETMPHVIRSRNSHMHMQDFQNCLCEFDKYCRVKSGLGRSKRRYPGTA